MRTVSVVTYIRTVTIIYTLCPVTTASNGSVQSHDVGYVSQS